MVCNSSLVSAQDSLAVAKLPVEIVRATIEKDVLVVYITGDGGWNTFSQDMGKSFASNGYSVVALNSRKYFWEAKTPDTFTIDIEKLSAHYLRKWKKSKCIIVGYSFGADVVAFLPLKLSKAFASQVTLLALLSPSASTDFVIKLSDLIGGADTPDRTYKVGIAVNKTTLPMLCIFGKDEDLILKRELQAGKMIHIEILPGSHRYNQGSANLVQHILHSYSKF